MIFGSYLKGLLIGIVATLSILNAGAQGFPSKPISLVVPYPAGGGSDFLARTIQVEYGKWLGQSVIVENVAGAGGSIGLQKVLSAPPDGYHQSVASLIELALTPLAMSAVKYKPEDFRLVAVIATTDLIVAIRQDIPAKTVGEFVTWGKGRKLSYGSIGQGSLYHLMGAQFGALTRLDMQHVPYKGIAPVMVDLAGGQIDMAVLPLLGPVAGMLKEGRFKALGITSVQSNPMFPDMPSISKQEGFTNFNYDVWVGVEVASDTPEALLQKLNLDLNDVLKNEDIQKKIVGSGASLYKPMNLADLDKLYKREIERYRAMFKAANIKPE